MDIDFKLLSIPLADRKGLSSRRDHLRMHNQMVHRVLVEQGKWDVMSVQSDLPIYIVGSGPASISCAQALVDDGYPVVILDAGIELEAERQQMVDALLASP